MTSLFKWYTVVSIISYTSEFDELVCRIYNTPMIRIHPSVLSGTVQAPASKEMAQRLLFAASLPPTPTEIRNMPSCGDVETAADVLRRFGCRIKREGSSLTVEPFPKTNPAAVLSLDFGKSSTAAGLGMSTAAAYGFRANCRGSEQLTRQRMLPLTGKMALRGVTFSSFSLPLEMQGRLEGGSYVFDGSEGSGFPASIMSVLPLLLDPSRVEIEGRLIDPEILESEIRMLSHFGIRIESAGDRFERPGRQIYESPGVLICENDWALSSLWIFAAALSAFRGSSVRVEGLQESSAQKYRNIGQIISLFSQDFSDISVDMSPAPELSCLAAAAAAFKGARAHLFGIPELRKRGIDRLQAMCSVLNGLGCEASCGEDSITVTPSAPLSVPEDAVIDCMDDAWIFMSMALCCGIAGRPYILRGERAAADIYEGFLEDLESLGGVFETVKR